ncbi:MAG: type VII toxin-antitoxin system HepT family RNase toxin [Thermoanaerobaculia bacterium]
MADINPDYLLEQFQLIEEYLRRAKGISARTKADVLNDPYAIDAGVREIVVLFETSHNVAKHLIARQGWRAPESKAEAFEILGEQGLLPDDLVEAFRQAARFRNLVTYQTAIVRDDMVYEVLQSHLADFERFLSAVAHWLRGQTTRP